MPLLMISFILVTIGGGCAAVQSRDCWFRASPPPDYIEALRPPADPLLDLFTMPYSPCEFMLSLRAAPDSK